MSTTELSILSAISLAVAILALWRAAKLRLELEAHRELHDDAQESLDHAQHRVLELLELIDDRLNADKSTPAALEGRPFDDTRSEILAKELAHMHQRLEEVQRKELQLTHRLHELAGKFGFEWREGRSGWTSGVIHAQASVNKAPDDVKINPVNNAGAEVMNGHRRAVFDDAASDVYKARRAVWDQGYDEGSHL